jgi:large subunit ribosomal protein L4
MVEAKQYRLDDAGESRVLSLNDQIFGGPVNPDLLYRAVRVQRANRRQGTSSTKTRGEVSGGGRKPWRQKGTGRARAGSRRSPLWPGGGTVFGPKPRSYGIKLTKKMRRSALRSALSDRAQSGRVVVLDRIAFDEPKTVQAISLLDRVGIEGSALVVVGSEEYGRPVKKSFSNLQHVKCLACAGINVYDVLRHESLVLTQQALDELEERFS